MNRIILFSVAGALALIAVIVYVWMFLPRDSTRSPRELGELALKAPSPEERERAAVELSEHGSAARDELRQALRQGDSVGVRAAAIQGLGVAYDYESVDDLFRALEDESPLIRGRAGVALQKMIGADVGYKANDPPAERAKKVAYLRHLWERMRGSVLEGP